MRIGIIGAGQLGLMLGEAAADLDCECVFVDPSANPPASQTGRVIEAAFDDANALAALAAECDVITYEFENVPVDALRQIPAGTPLYPPPEALRVAQDRQNEKQLFEQLDIPLPGHRSVDTRDELDAAVAELGLPAVVKTRRFGYDGKGQFVIRNNSDTAEAWNRLGGSALIVEAWVPFDVEVSVIGARNPDGMMVTWPLSQNRHRDGILRTSRAPVDNAALTTLARDYIGRLLDHLDYVGVLALELFVVGNALLANEFAPRVHNSGHWTIEGAQTSQFANHVLAILGRPLGETQPIGHSGMVNLIGTMPDPGGIPADRRLFLHDYGKAPREGRKLGHITAVAETPDARDALVASLEKV